MVTDDPLICWLILQVDFFYVVHHVRDATKAAGAILIRVPFVANANDTLGFLADKGDLHRGGVGIGTWTFFLCGSITIGESRCL